MHLLLLLAACTTGNISLGDKDTAATGDDTAADTDTDTAADTDTDTEPAENPYTGEYAGTVALAVEDPRGGESMDVCVGEAALTIDAAGALAGEGSCSNPDAPGELVITFVGTVGDDGAALGEVTQTFPDGAETYEVTGGFGAGALGLTWSGMLVTPRGDEMAFEGRFEAE